MSTNTKDQVPLPSIPSTSTSEGILPTSPDQRNVHHPGCMEDPSSRILGKPFKPPVVRHYSWSEEDRKHALQARLLASEEGKERGFTEVEAHRVE
ncbi:hypothetical protein BO78DRAFT_379280 [Aspergillus sclerotiicarbonarius CBS 121057]|uniref:Uncharacterized protein n=1 Tax=Aspergillus sclerotiicarbonarius (strain CBS 121057 / IBT 28362) TaxID=1448318 RepID=A0A319DV91_ASPSB|nr:hypothetical protein BO78DRAFT_379280 [Aspergillus sclerotiicarbonarius CBS 121057]